MTWIMVRNFFYFVVVVLFILLMLIGGAGCDMFGRFQQVSAYCSKKQVENAECVVCSAAGDSIGVHCNWR